jgi:hypothetical protein
VILANRRKFLEENEDENGDLLEWNSTKANSVFWTSPDNQSLPSAIQWFADVLQVSFINAFACFW